MKNYWFLFWAYNVVWICLAAYIGWLVRRLGQTRRRLERLEQRVEGSSGAQKSSTS